MAMDNRLIGALVLMGLVVAVGGIYYIGSIVQSGQVQQQSLLEQTQREGMIDTGSSTFMGTNPTRGFYSDASSFSTYENVTLTNFTSSGEERPFALKIYLNGFVQGFSVSLDFEASNLEDNVTLKDVGLYSWNTQKEIASYGINSVEGISPKEIDGKKLDAESIVVLSGIAKSTYIAGNAGVEKLWDGTVSVRSGGSPGTNEATSITPEIWGGSYTS